MNLQRLFKEWPTLVKRIQALEEYCLKPQRHPKDQFPPGPVQLYPDKQVDPEIIQQAWEATPVAQFPETPTIQPKVSDHSPVTPRAENWRKRNRVKGS